MPRALRYYVDDSAGNTLTNSAWSAIARLQHWYNSEFIWSCDRIGLKRYILFPNYEQIPDMPYHTAKYHFRKRLLAKKIELQDEVAAVRVMEEEGLFTVRWGGARDNSIASGITHVADNEFNAYLLCEFLLKCSTIATDASFTVEDEGRFVVCRRVAFRNGEVLAWKSDVSPDQEVSLDIPQLFAVVDAARYDNHPRFTQSIEDFDDLDEETRIESTSDYRALGFANNFDTAWGDGGGLNLQARARKVSIILSLLLFLLPLTACAQEVSDRSTIGRHHMVSSATPEATAAGIEVLRRGGNAVDAAVAVGFALAVTYPEAGNLGGGGFMVLRLASGTTIAIDFRETAPRRATRDMFLDSAGNVIRGLSTSGPLAVGIPGSPAGLLLAHERYGRLERSAVMAPAIRLAREGFVASRELAEDLAGRRGELLSIPATAAAWAPSGRLPVHGDTIRQPDLAQTLDRMARHGRAGFYEGATADRIAAFMEKTGGLIDRDDLRGYRPIERQPIMGTYRGYTVISMPPPSSGGVLLVQMLNVFSGYDFAGIGWHSTRHVHLLVETMRRAYADRAVFLGDPDFVDVPVKSLTSPSYAARLRSDIGDRATRSTDLRFGDSVSLPKEGAETTHFSVIDKEGNAVAVTTTLNGYFGNKMVVEGAGFFLNNEMDDFSARPGSPNMFELVGGSANEIVPGKRMLSSMTPTIVLREGSPWLIVGTPGGSTIITTVLQVIHAQIDFGMSLYDAIEQPRIHHQWLPDRLMYEADALAPWTVDSLRAIGHTTARRAERSGRVDAIRIEHDATGRRLIGWSDSRGSGRADGD